MSRFLKHPDKFLTVRVHELCFPAGLTGLCAGYEEGKWRSLQLASHLLEWLPEFALTYSEREGVGSHNAVALLAKAARTVYTTEKCNNRGEVGELLLHIAVRQVFKTIPVISKYFFKDSENDTVKGFDTVHVVVDKGSLELWLGEAKFYSDINKAIRDVVGELRAHTKRNYLRSEFATITNKIDANWPYKDRLKKLLHQNTSLDEIFDCICIPVFLTYESPTIASFVSVTETFKSAFINEVKKHHASFCNNPLPQQVRIHLFLFPLKSRKELLHEFDERLKACQAMVQ